MLDGFKVDLLPAPNLVQFSRDSNIDSKDAQRSEAMRMIGRKTHFDAREALFWGSTLAESTVSYMEQQPSFVITAVRLAKLWEKQRVVGAVNQKIPRWFASDLVEVVAISLADKEMRQSSRNASLARFLIIITMELRNLRLFP